MKIMFVTLCDYTWHCWITICTSTKQNLCLSNVWMWLHMIVSISINLGALFINAPTIKIIRIAYSAYIWHENLTLLLHDVSGGQVPGGEAQVFRGTIWSPHIPWMFACLHEHFARGPQEEEGNGSDWWEPGSRRPGLVSLLCLDGPFPWIRLSHSQFMCCVIMCGVRVPWIKCSDPGCCIQTIQMDWVVLLSGFSCRSAVYGWTVVSCDFCGSIHIVQ